MVQVVETSLEEILLSNGIMLMSDSMMWVLGDAFHQYVRSHSNIISHVAYVVDMLYCGMPL